MDVVKLLHDQAWHIKNQGRFWMFMEDFQGGRPCTKLPQPLNEGASQTHGVIYDTCYAVAQLLNMYKVVHVSRQGTI